MDATIFLALAQDGVVNGAIFGLLSVALVMVFAVTRVIFIPQGEFVAFGALTFDQLRSGVTPGTSGLLLALGVAAFSADLCRLRGRPPRGWWWRHLAADVAYPVALLFAVRAAAPLHPGILPCALLTCLMVGPIGSAVYRLAFQPLEQASVLLLLIAAMGVHLALTTLGLVFFGPEGSEVDPFFDFSLDLGQVSVAGQSIAVVVTAAAVMAGMLIFFGRTLAGKALRAVAINRTGARVVGIRPGQAGMLAMGIAALIGAITGVLIAPVTMVYYDSGFLIGLKGFVAAIVGGMGSYPLALAGSLAVGLIQSFAAFWSSAYVEALVFMALVPVLLLRSMLRPKRADPE